MGLFARPYWAAAYRGRGADLPDAVLILADLAGADLRRADLRHANLSGADLTGADLTGAKLDGATLAGAVFDEYTQWPDGYVAQEHGAVVAW